MEYSDRPIAVVGSHRAFQDYLRSIGKNPKDTKRYVLINDYQKCLGLIPQEVIILYDHREIPLCDQIIWRFRYLNVPIRYKKSIRTRKIPT